MKWICAIAICLFPALLKSQDVEIKGTVLETTGEGLPLANVVILPDSILATADLSGAFSARIAPGLKTLRITYTGYQSVIASRQIDTDTVFSFMLTQKAGLLEEVVVAADRFSHEDIVHTAFAGKQMLTANDLAKLPAMMGEPDLLAAVRLLPGNTRGMDGSSDTFIRGGAADQNLVLLDGAPVYNTGHLLGFVSVFNPDIVEKVDVINGGFPAEFGGRLSSVLDISSVSSIPEKFGVSLDAGVISSRIKVEQPIITDKAGFWISARRSYIDKLMKKSQDKDILYAFQDINGKLVFHPSETHQVEISHYQGRDVLDFFRDRDLDGRGMLTTYHSTNSAQSFKWMHTNPRLWRNELTLFRSSLDSRTENEYKDYAVGAFSEIEDYGAKFRLSRDSVWRNTSITAGLEWVRHLVSPSVLNSSGSIAEVLQSGSTPGRMYHEFAAFLQQEFHLSRIVTVNAGIRTSLAATGSTRYLFPEPRLSARFALGSHSALKVNYTRMMQYIHRISNSAVTTPIDIWYPVTDNIRPQRSHQVSVAFQQFVPGPKAFLSIESYYKAMDDLLAFEEGTNLLYRSDLASNLTMGKGKAYGLELLLRKDAGAFTGWISYSLSWSWRQFDLLNNGEWFHARYDRRHNGAIVAQHRLGKRWAASMVWEYISGSRFTPIIGQYVTVTPNDAGLDLVPLFADMNSVKLSDTHRLDLGLKFFSKTERKFHWTAFAGIYNVYNRATPIGIAITPDKETNELRYSQPGLFGFLPCVSFGCKI